MRSTGQRQCPQWRGKCSQLEATAAAQQVRITKCQSWDATSIWLLQFILAT